MTSTADRMDEGGFVLRPPEFGRWNILIPENPGKYLVVVESPWDKPDKTTGFWDGEHWIGDWAPELYVVAWMPLPEYP